MSSDEDYRDDELHMSKRFKTSSPQKDKPRAHDGNSGSLEIRDRVDETSESSDEEQVETDRYWPLPASKISTITVSFQGKRVSALSFNNAGTRCAIGSHEYDIKIWDFTRFDRPKNFQPCGSTVINSLDYSLNDELILVIPGNSQATIVGKDGQVIHQCPKGDQYIKDMTHTKGHVQMLNDGCFHPKEKGIFITSSNDGTIRLWNLNNKSLQQERVIKVRSPSSGLKSNPNVCRYSRDCSTLATGCNDGSLIMWDTRAKFVTSSACVKNAHSKGCEITGLDFSFNLTSICTRSEDETCKIWDLRKLKVPLAVKAEIKTSYSNSDCVFSPDDKLVLVGTSGKENELQGELLALASDDLSEKTSIKVEDGAVVRCRWHPKINHIAYTTSKGVLHIAYDEKRSIGGLLGCLDVNFGR